MKKSSPFFLYLFISASKELLLKSMFIPRPGCFNKMSNMGLPIGKITEVLLTHFHSDHICELGEINTMSWAASGRCENLPVYGPPGVIDVVNGFNMAYKQDSTYREDHHSRELMKKEYAPMHAHEIPLPGGSHESAGKPGRASTRISLRPKGSAKNDDADELVVTAFNVDHRPVLPAFGFRFEYRGRTSYYTATVSLVTDTILSQTETITVN